MHPEVRKLLLEYIALAPEAEVAQLTPEHLALALWQMARVAMAIMEATEPEQAERSDAAQG
jgi:hypothetical protein